MEAVSINNFSIIDARAHIASYSHKQFYWLNLEHVNV